MMYQSLVLHWALCLFQTKHENTHYFTNRNLKTDEGERDNLWEKSIKVCGEERSDIQKNSKSMDGM